MNVLLLRLCGPMQSWGVQSRFSVRDTGLEPSKSGVIGLLCAALGRPRPEPLADLAALRMGVRVDREGVLHYDYHTASNLLKAGGGIKETEPSRRYYLADAGFLVGLEGAELGLLEVLHGALRDPVWPLFLGRKSFVPGKSVWLEDGLRPGATLEAALRAYGQCVAMTRAGERSARFVFEDERGTEVRPDQPISFAERLFVTRRVQTTFGELPAAIASPV